MEWAIFKEVNKYAKK